MKIPKEILIGDKLYKVKEKHFIFNQRIAGKINYGDQKIEIKKSINSKSKEDTFFHEIAHGLFKELEFNHPKIVSFRNNENLVQELGLILRTTFLDLLKKQKEKKV